MELTSNFGDSGGDAQESTEVTSESSNDEFSGNSFLQSVPAEHRGIVGPYVKQWDSGAQKKFKEYQERIKPYEQLGQVDEVQKYVNFARNFQRDPEMAFRLMYQGMQEQFGDQFDSELSRILQLEGQQQMSEEFEEYDNDGEPDPNEVFQQNVSSELEELRTWRDNFEQSQQEAQEQQALDNLLTEMHKVAGDFDNDWILTRLAAGRTVQESLQDWNNMVSKYSSNGSSRQAPKVMGGQGGVPSGQVDATQLRGKERRNAVAAMLAGLE